MNQEIDREPQNPSGGKNIRKIRRFAAPPAEKIRKKILLIEANSGAFAYTG
jgi:hypothetical protein